MVMWVEYWKVKEVNIYTELFLRIKL